MATTQDIARDFHIPIDIERHIDPASPVPVRMMGAAGTLPLAPKVLISVLYVLLGDSNEKVAATARASLMGLPSSLIVNAIDTETHPRILEFLAFQRPDEAILETVVLRRQTNDKTICYLAETASANIVEIIAGNQERALVTPEIYLHLKVNPECPVSLLEKMESWHRMNGIVLESDDLVQEPVFEEPTPRPPPFPREDHGPEDLGPPPALAPGSAEFLDEYAHAEAEAGPPPILGPDDPFLALLQDLGIEIKPEYFDGGPDLAEDPVEAAEQAEREARMMGRDHLEAEDVNTDGGTDLLTPMAGADFTFSLDRGVDDDWDLDLLMDHSNVDEEFRQSLGKRIGAMSVGEKIKLSYLGNKEVREILIKDTNKMVCAAVVKSGRLTDPEVVKASSNRAISEEVLRLIGQNREWLRKYPVKVALVNNPKTPAGVSMSLLGGLHIKDLRALSGNKNIPSVVSNSATQRCKQRAQN